MIRRSLLLLVPVVAALAAAACSDTVETRPGPAGDGGVTPAPTGDGGTPGSGPLPFTPSNIDLSGIDLSNVGDFVVDASSCSFETRSKEVSCGESDKIAFGLVEQSGGGKVAVYVARSFRVETNASLVTRGTFPLVIVALDTMEVLGGVDVGAKESGDSAGGFKYQGPPTSRKGGGPGGGNVGTSTNAGAGGSYCGLGGEGPINTAGGTPATGGTAYGTPENIPLIGGSAGGGAGLPFSGTGGGAVQLVAGKKFTLAANGYVHAGGGGGSFAGAVKSQPGAGGGSGGAILIEAPEVSLLGALIANGGAGGAKDNGQDSKTDGTVATSPPQTNGSIGGPGSAGESINGGNGTWVADDPGGGGGGAAGRIRVNSTTGNNALSARLLSPSANTPCTTEGTLRPR